MAENRVIITVVSENRTKEGFDQAKQDADRAGYDVGRAFAAGFRSEMKSAEKDAADSGDNAGKSFMSKFGSWLTGGQTKGLFGNAGAGGGIGGILSTIGSSGPAGIGAAAVAAGALLVELDGVVAGFAAAGAGAGAFAALALPAFKVLQANYSQLVTNQQDFANASQNIATAISSSAKVAAAYQKSIADPSTRSAILLLNDQNTVWQNLTTAQQNSVIALSDNKKALALLIPDQKTALSILLKEADAWGNMTPSQQAAAGALDNIRIAYDKMSLAFQPTAFKLFGQALQVVVDLMPKLLPLANAFSNALAPLLVKLDQFVQSKGFQQWFQQFLAYVGPATSAIGKGLGEVAISFGKLLTVLPPADVVRSIGIAFGVVNEALIVLTKTVQVSLGPLSALASLLTLIAGSGGNSRALSGPNVANIPGNLGNLSKLNLSGLAPFASPGVGPGSSKLGHLAGGGPGSGLTVVGEFGPELVDLPSGSFVHPAGTFGSGGAPQIVMHWGSPQTQALVRALWPDMMLEVRTRGGGGANSAQVALGQTH